MTNNKYPQSKRKLTKKEKKAFLRLLGTLQAKEIVSALGAAIRYTTIAAAAMDEVKDEAEHIGILNADLLCVRDAFGEM